MQPEVEQHFMGYAALRAQHAGIHRRLSLTTNGAASSLAAWSIMIRPNLDLAVSCDGLPAVHDKHRRMWDGRGTSDLVLVTMLSLLEA